ncbi:MAG TPA: tetratricopeptide repeat protein, partial [Vulgatibacter sp.]
MLTGHTVGEDLSFKDLERTLTEGARWNELLQLYEGRLEREAEGPQASLILARAAGLLMEKLRDPNRAEGLLRRLLERDPDNEAGRDGLQQIYEERGDHEALCDLLEREALRAPSPREAADAYVELGRLLDEKLGRKTRALVMWQRALRLVEDHPQAQDLAQRCSVELGRLDAARDLLSRALAARPENAKALALRFAQLGNVALEQPSRHELAAACANDALAADPSCEAGRVVLESVEALRADWKSEVRALRARAVDERDRKVASGLYLQAAALHAAFDLSAESEDRSRECLERAFLLWPGNPEALDFLERRHSGNGDFEGLVRAYEALVGVTPENAGKAELHLRLAMLWSVRFDDKARSVAALEQAVALDPGRTEAVVPLLEHLEDERQPDRAIELVERYLSAGGSSPRAVDLRLRLAELYLAEGDKDRARSHLESTLRKDPRCERAEVLLEPLLDPQLHAVALARLLEGKSDRQRDPRSRRDLLVRASRLSLPSPKERLRLLGRALIATPGDADLHAELEQVGRESQGSEAVAHLYQAALVSADDPSVRLALLVRLAHVYDRDLGRASDGAACLRQAVALSPEDPALATSLEKLMEKAGEHAALAAAHQEKLAHTEDPAQRRILLEKLAVHYEKQAGDPTAAVEIYRQLLAIGPDPSVQRKLAAALGGLSRWSEQREALEALAAMPGEEGLAARMELAVLLASRLGAPEDAADLHLRILAEAADSQATVSALEALLHAGVAVDRIGAALCPIFESKGEWHRLASVLEARVAAERDPASRRGHLVALARIHGEKLGDARGAFDSLSRAFVDAPEG